MVKMTTSEEHRECPLCMDALDYDDLNFYPCACHYQVCRFCWSRLINEENGLCPNCRKPYNSEEPAEFKPATDEEVVKRKKERKKVEQQKKQRVAENRKHLSDVRVLQKNLVFVTNLPIRLSDKEALKGGEYFGKYGKVYKVIINKNTIANNQNSQQTVGAYVTYHRVEDALRAIIELNRLHIDGRNLKASLGTTKYCSQFLRGTPCTKHECMYLHEFGEDAASFTKDEMSLSKHTEYEARLIDHFQATMTSSSVSPSDNGGTVRPIVDQTNNNSRFSPPGQSELSMSPYRQSPLPTTPHDPGNSPTPPPLPTPSSSTTIATNGGGNSFDRAPGSVTSNLSSILGGGNFYGGQQHQNQLYDHHDSALHQLNLLDNNTNSFQTGLGQNGDLHQSSYDAEDDASALDFDPVSEAQHGLALAMESEGLQQQQALAKMWDSGPPPGYHYTGAAPHRPGGYPSFMGQPHHQQLPHSTQAFNMASLQRNLQAFPGMESPFSMPPPQSLTQHSHSPPVHSFTPPIDPYRPPSQNSPARGQSWLYPSTTNFLQQPQQNGNSGYSLPVSSPTTRNGGLPPSHHQHHQQQQQQSAPNNGTSTTPATKPSWHFQVQPSPPHPSNSTFPINLSTKMGNYSQQMQQSNNRLNSGSSGGGCWSTPPPPLSAFNSLSSNPGQYNMPLLQHQQQHNHQMMPRDSLTSTTTSRQQANESYLSTTADTAMSAAFSVFQ